MLFASQNDGGLALHNLIYYYYVAYLKAIDSWVTLPAYNLWTVKLWLAPNHPKILLWNADTNVPHACLLHSMALLRGL